VRGCSAASDDRAVADPTRVIWRRGFAYAVDLILTTLVLVATLLVAGDFRTVKGGCPNPVPAGHDCFHYRSSTYLMRDRAFVWFAVALVILVVVVVVVPHAVVGSSLGKAILGIRVVRADGSPPGVLRSSLRVGALVVDGLALGLPLGLWLMIVTTGHRRVGDFLAGTYVVRRSDAGRPLHIPPGGFLRRRRASSAR
jgi:uncharacterized RDD family membrane protein YckC